MTEIFCLSPGLGSDALDTANKTGVIWMESNQLIINMHFSYQEESFHEI